MSNVIPPVAAPVEPPAPVVPVHQSPRDNLPSGLKIDPKHSADGFFEKHKEANTPGAVPPAVVVPPVAVVAPEAKPAVAPAPAVVEPAVQPAKGSLVEKLAARGKVAAPVEPAPGATPGKNPEDDIKVELTPGTPRAAQWDQLRGITAGLRDQLNAARESERQLKTQLEGARTVPAPVDTAELDRLRADNKAMSDRLAITDLREHPQFQREFITPQQEALAAAGALLVANGVPAGDISGLLLKPRAELGKAVAELTKNLPDFDRVEFSENIRKAYTLNQQAGTALARSREIYGGIRAKTEGDQRQAFDRTWGRAAGQVAEHIVELEVPDNATPDQRTEIEQYNAAFQGLRTVAEHRAFGPAGPEVISENAIKSAAYDFHIQKAMPRMMKEIDGLLANNRALAAELRAIRGRNPNLQLGGTSSAGGSGGAGPDGTLSAAQLSKMTHAEAAAALSPRR